MNLKQRMAENGFESNDNYDFVLKTLANRQANSIACLNIEGDAGRRKTAFANALANAQDHVSRNLYFDFSFKPTKAAPTQTSSAQTVKPLDKILSDACAFSEAESTILILDQLQLAPFDEHMRLYNFLISKEWSYGSSTFYANPRNLQLYLISEQSIYHSLQKHSFKVWVEKISNKITNYQPQDFKLGSDFAPIMQALNELFNALNVAPTFSEYQKILLDIPVTVRTLEDVSHTLYGWMEGIERSWLKEPQIMDMLQYKVMPAIEQYLGVDDIIASVKPTSSES